MASRRKALVAGAAFVLAALTPLEALAQSTGRGAVQNPPRGGQRGQIGGRGQPTMSPRDVQVLFDSYVIMQAREVLELTPEQEGQFIPRARQLQEVRRRMMMQRGRHLGQLNHALRAASNDAQLDAAVRAYDEHERTAIAEVQKAYANVDQILTPRQRARFRVLEDQLERKMQDMLARVRQGNRRE